MMTILMDIALHTNPRPRMTATRAAAGGWPLVQEILSAGSALCVLHGFDHPRVWLTHLCMSHCMGACSAREPALSLSPPFYLAFLHRAPHSA